MLISRMPDVDDGTGDDLDETQNDDHTHEYRTANELFDIMAKNQNFDTTEDQSLTTRDLVILYKNIEIGTELMTNANEYKRNKPNQYVESIIHGDDAETDGSDVSEIYSNEDIHNVFLINNERIDLLNNRPSFENTLCQKFGNLEMQSSDLTTDYDKQFLFKDPYIKQQLNGLDLLKDKVDGTILPASLLDYICCKRLDDNYSFYMDNVIRYVTQTIEHLKRISNGDYLTDRVKEKWREGAKAFDDDYYNNNAIILATSTSIPLHVERTDNGNVNARKDVIVHSEVDIRSLSKILERKVVIEIPKLFSGSYKLFRKHFSDNLIVSRKKGKEEIEDEKKKSKVVIQLKRSESAHITNNISSIMILQGMSSPLLECEPAKPLPLCYKELEYKDEKVKVIELDDKCINENIEQDQEINNNNDNDNDNNKQSSLREQSLDCDQEMRHDNSTIDTNDYSNSETYFNGSLRDTSNNESSESNIALRDVLSNKSDTKVCIDSHNVLADDLRLTMHRLNKQTTVPEESFDGVSVFIPNKPKSQEKIRIKSPYENKSHILEERKRKKLLEIRDRREKKKMSMSENCKISKHKYGRGAIMPQASSSVTKLSITNKSFYNSIYGQTLNNKQSKNYGHKGQKKRIIPMLRTDDAKQEFVEKILTPEKNNKKYINRSYYLDDAVTEMMFIQVKQKSNNEEVKESVSTSVLSNDFSSGVNMLSRFVNPSISDFSNKEEMAYNTRKSQRYVNNAQNKQDIEVQKLISSQSILNVTPTNTPKNIVQNTRFNDNKTTSIDCRKSIDKIYNLIKKVDKSDNAVESNPVNSNITSISKNKMNITIGRANLSLHSSDSNNSFKNNMASSIPSCFSFRKINNRDHTKQKHSENRRSEIPTTVVPKVIISTKSQMSKIDGNKNDRKRNTVAPTKIASENPLKAISQLLHEFDNVQRNRQKATSEVKTSRKSAEPPNDGRAGSQQSSFKKHGDQHLKDSESTNERQCRISRDRDRKIKQSSLEPKMLHQQITVEDKHVERLTKKKIAEIIDEAKEARGEAVRGPSKPNSRLNSLAQPKRIYVQAHSEEYQTRYGRNLMADRLQRLASAPQPNAERATGSANSRSRQKRGGTEGISPVNVKQMTHIQPIEKVRTRRSHSNSPDNKRRSSPMNEPSYKQNNVPETSTILNKKMVAVESYVKTHYGRVPSVPACEGGCTHKARAPLVPEDVELESVTSLPTVEESTALGTKLHHIIHTIIKSNQSGLTALTECTESYSKNSRENTESVSLTENLLRSDEPTSIDSDYPVNIYEDKHILTAVEDVQLEDKNEEKVVDEIVEVKTIAQPVEIENTKQLVKGPLSPVTELEELENALCRKISVGAFPKRLRIKNFTLTPKHSVQQNVLLLQAGDVGPLVKSTLKITASKSEHLSDLKALPTLSKSDLSWSFANFPMQISTVGYAFPKFHALQSGSSRKIRSTNGNIIKSSENTISELTISSVNQFSQFFKCSRSETRLEQTTEGNLSATPDNFTKINPITTPENKTHDEINKTEIIFKKDIIVLPQDENDGTKSDITDKCSEINKKITTKTTVQGNVEHADYTASLDMLVGLLNEIQKITACQTNITNPMLFPENNHKENEEKIQLERLLNDATSLENSVNDSPRNLVSFASFDSLKKIDSNASIYSIYISNNKDRKLNENELDFISNADKMNIMSKPCCVDKEVTVFIPDKEYVNRFTDVPSQVLPINVNHSTNYTNPLIEVMSKSSNPSLFSFTNFQTLYCNVSFDSNENMKFPQIITKEDCCEKSSHVIENIIDEQQKLCESGKKSKKLLNVNTVLKDTVFDQSVVAGKNNVHDNKKIINEKTYCVAKTEFDPVMKMKRDILVTVYSILVFTVFVALSFPEVVYVERF